MNPKVLIGLLIVVILAFLGFNQSPVLGVLILVIGAAGVIFAVQKMGDGEGRKTKKVNKFDDAESGGTSSRAATLTDEPAEDNLPAWGGLSSWSGPTEAEPTTYDEPAAESASWDSGASWDSTDSGDSSDSGDTWGTWSSDTTTLGEESIDLDTEFEQTFGSGEYDALGGFESTESTESSESGSFGSFESFGGEEESSTGGYESFESETTYEEPAAEPEPLGAFSFGSAPKVINEDVSTADEIMAASAATELHVDEAAENSELAKLLAKVQARLSAYE